MLLLRVAYCNGSLEVVEFLWRMASCEHRKNKPDVLFCFVEARVKVGVIHRVWVMVEYIYRIANNLN